MWRVTEKYSQTERELNESHELSLHKSMALIQQCLILRSL
jgi:hypothetical protein